MYILYSKCNEKIKVFKRKWTGVSFTIFKFTILAYVLRPSLFLYHYILFSLDPTSCKFPNWMLYIVVC